MARPDDGRVMGSMTIGSSMVLSPENVLARKTLVAERKAEMPGQSGWLLVVTCYIHGLHEPQGGTPMSPSHRGDPAACLAVRDVLNRVGDKWSVLIISLLGAGPMRFNELRR